ncbi:hypothetical protein L1987_69547 [Smallanthus sonchifolius]|uniref:Uncharacterized protein n=1 Tax=Smallanthus sonchifolius TaxID=185202 RepID=A0ACB9B6N6_9ASTR|nr:hypothetical protein L1987_69547 [Smallanthus sonchifolius]
MQYNKHKGKKKIPKRLAVCPNLSSLVRQIGKTHGNQEHEYQGHKKIKNRARFSWWVTFYLSSLVHGEHLIITYEGRLK